MSRVLVVGAGAAGLMAAGMAAQYGAEVTLLERNARPARKVMITGKGRCNVTNACDIHETVANIPSNGRFLFSALSAFSQEDMRDLLFELGVETKIERGNRVFPVSDKAVDVVDALVKFAHREGVRTVQERAVELVIENGCCVGVKTESGAVYEADTVAICTGGLSYPKTGSDGDGYALAKQAGHTVVALRPSLVPLCIREYDCSQMQGLSLKNVTLTVTDTEKQRVIFEELGEMMFAHFGITGPLVLSASAHMREMRSGRYTVSIDLKPGLDEVRLNERVMRELNDHRNAAVSTMLSTLLPRLMIPTVASRSGIGLSTPCHSVTKEQRARLMHVLKHLTYTVEAFRPIDEAIVTSGGISVKEIDSKTMASKLCDGLYFAGEIIDVDAYTGGFNLQIAFSTGVAAGRAMAMR